MLKSMGGLPETLSIPTDAPATPIMLVAGTAQHLRTVMDQGRIAKRIASVATPALSTKSEVPLAKATIAEAKPLVAETLFAGLGFALLDAFMIDSGPHYVSGFADITVPGQPTKPAIGAFIYFHQPGGMDHRAGRADAPADIGPIRQLHPGEFSYG